MRIVVTGATSMIGVALINKAIKAGDEVLAIIRPGTDRIHRLTKHSKIQYKYASLDELKSLNVSGCEYDVFYHFAWDYTNRKDRDNPILQQKNISTTLDAVMLANRLNCKKFIGAGSQAEFGIHDDVIVESTVCNPIISYGIAKYTASMLSQKLCEQLGITFIWPRICSVYGCNDNNNTMIRYAIEQFINGDIAKFTSAQNIWNYVFEKDAGEMFLRFGHIDKVEGYFLVASNCSMPLRQYIEILANVFGAKNLCSFSRDTVSEKLVQLNVDANETFLAIDYIPQTSFYEGILTIKNNIDKFIL